MAHPMVANKKARELSEQQFVDPGLVGHKLAWCVSDAASASRSRPAPPSGGPRSSQGAGQEGPVPPPTTLRLTP